MTTEGGDPGARLERLVEGYEREVKHRPPQGADEDGVDEVDGMLAAAGGLEAAPGRGGNRLARLDPTLAEIAVPAVAEAPAAPVGRIALGAGAAPSEAPGSSADEAAASAAFEHDTSAAVAQPVEPEDLETWWSRGERIPLRGGGRTWQIFVRTLGEGPWLTAIHGFPTSSWDWEPVSRTLRASHRILAPDLLGFGDSDKPTGHDWSAFEQADLIESLWRREGITETRILAHDVGLTVALELLARQEEGGLATRITDLTLLNGGVYSGFHRPRRIQVLLQKPIVGAIIARLLSEGRFAPALSEIFAPEHRLTPLELHQHWLSVARRNGGRNYHRLIRYIPERRAHAARWEAALARTQTPIRFVWGMVDPVSGAHMAEAIRQRRPGADIVALDDVGHYPQLEAPERVVDAVLRRRA
jgi:pimeloyl-ACP methyl ester carboxylesterase